MNSEFFELRHTGRGEDGREFVPRFPGASELSAMVHRFQPTERYVIEPDGYVMANETGAILYGGRLHPEPRGWRDLRYSYLMSAFLGVVFAVGLLLGNGDALGLGIAAVVTLLHMRFVRRSRIGRRSAVHALGAARAHQIAEDLDFETERRRQVEIAVEAGLPYLDYASGEIWPAAEALANLADREASEENARRAAEVLPEPVKPPVPADPTAHRVLNWLAEEVEEIHSAEQLGPVSYYTRSGKAALGRTADQMRRVIAEDVAAQARQALVPPAEVRPAPRRTTEDAKAEWLLTWHLHSRGEITYAETEERSQRLVEEYRRLRAEGKGER